MARNATWNSVLNSFEKFLHFHENQSIDNKILNKDNSKTQKKLFISYGSYVTMHTKEQWYRGEADSSTTKLYGDDSLKNVFSTMKYHCRIWLQ